MKQITAALLAGLLLLSGCASKQEQAETVQIANPWVEYETLEEAESAVGFSLGIPGTVADSYHAESFRVMNGELLEVCYRDETFEVTVRKMAGEGQDISGDYTEYEAVNTLEYDGAVITVKHTESEEGTLWLHLISCKGYSWSLRAPEGYWGDSNGDFLKYIY